MDPSRLEHRSEEEKVISPFAQSEAVISKSRRSGGKLFLFIGLGLVPMVLGAAVKRRHGKAADTCSGSAFQAQPHLNLE
jgi:hypothetical protein